MYVATLFLKLKLNNNDLTVQVWTMAQRDTVDSSQENTQVPVLVAFYLQVGTRQSEYSNLQRQTGVGVGRAQFPLETIKEDRSRKTATVKCLARVTWAI